jgi:hypothetical protein
MSSNLQVDDVCGSGGVKAPLLLKPKENKMIKLKKEDYTIIEDGDFIKLINKKTGKKEVMIKEKFIKNYSFESSKKEIAKDK